MGILAECPYCHRKQSIKKKNCPNCGESMDASKKAGRVKYWITYRDQDGKQKREYVGSFKDLDGYSIEDARKANAKRVVQKAEGTLMDVKEDSRMTFNELTEWYLSLEKTKALASAYTVSNAIRKFNLEFGKRIISSVKLAELENYQEKRRKAGAADGTIDHEIGKTKAMINRAFDNGMISADTMRAFKAVKQLVKGNADARTRVLSKDEFQALYDAAQAHLKPVLATAYYTGMRKGEIVRLTWNKVDLKSRMIHLSAADTKDREARDIPICDELLKELKTVPRSINSQRVFLYNGKPLGEFKKSLQQACEKAKILFGRDTEGGFVFHDLRHTFNTNMRKAGVQESVIMKITGHSTRKMFDRYNTIDAQDARDAVDQLETFFEKVDQKVDQAAKNE